MLKAESIRKNVPAMYTLPACVYVDKDGKVVGHKDKNKLTLIGHKGTEIPMEWAERLGIVGLKAEEIGYPKPKDSAAVPSTAEPEAEARAVAEQSAKADEWFESVAGAKSPDGIKAFDPETGEFVAVDLTEESPPGDTAPADSGAAPAADSQSE